MNKRQKSKFVRDLTKAVTKQILDRVPDTLSSYGNTSLTCSSAIALVYGRSTSQWANVNAGMRTSTPSQKGSFENAM